MYARSKEGIYRIVHINEDGGYWYGKTLSRLPAESVIYDPAINLLTGCLGCKDTFTIPGFGATWKRSVRQFGPASVQSPDVTSAYDAAVTLFAKACYYDKDVEDILKKMNPLMYSVALGSFTRATALINYLRDMWMASGPACNNINQVILNNWDWSSSLSNWEICYGMSCSKCNRETEHTCAYAGNLDGQLPIAIMGKIVGHPHLWDTVLLDCECGVINTCKAKTVIPPRIIFAQTGLMSGNDSIARGYTLDNTSTYTAHSVEYSVFGTVYMELCTGHYVTKVCIEGGDRAGNDCWAFVDDRVSAKKFRASRCRYTTINDSGKVLVPMIFGLLSKVGS